MKSRGGLGEKLSLLVIHSYQFLYRLSGRDRFSRNALPEDRTTVVNRWVRRDAYSLRPASLSNPITLACWLVVAQLSAVIPALSLVLTSAP